MNNELQIKRRPASNHILYQGAANKILYYYLQSWFFFLRYYDTEKPLQKIR